MLVEVSSSLVYCFGKRKKYDGHEKGIVETDSVLKNMRIGLVSHFCSLVFNRNMKATRLMIDNERNFGPMESMVSWFGRKTGIRV